MSFALKTQLATIGWLILTSLPAMPQTGAPPAPFVDYGESKQGSSKSTIPSCGSFSSAHTTRQSPASRSRHRVTLTWNASVPASRSNKDAVQGYYVYRSQASHSYPKNSRLNATPIKGTTCIDKAVEPRAVYYYSVRAISRSGAQSVLSQEVKAAIPFP